MLSRVILLSVLPCIAHPQSVRPTICVEAHFVGPGSVYLRDKLIVQAHDHAPDHAPDPEQAVAGVAADFLRSKLGVFDFTARCPQAAPALRHLHLTFFPSTSLGWPAAELQLRVDLQTGGQDLGPVMLGTVLKRHPAPLPKLDTDASWLKQAIADGLLTQWQDPSVRRLFSSIPIQIKATRSGDRVILNATRADLGQLQDKAVLSDEGQDMHPDMFFRICNDEPPGGPFVLENSVEHCDQLRGPASASHPPGPWPRIYLWYFSGRL
ncbi:MAG TPA: hypothetical protein VND93_17900 [Myxococcales bacterium]|nr:hypothetical protein [Myxococcales bacterium]